jgi:hypothetical protein
VLYLIACKARSARCAESLHFLEHTVVNPIIRYLRGRCVTRWYFAKKHFQVKVPENRSNFGPVETERHFRRYVATLSN